MCRTLLLFGAVLVVAACDNSPTAPALDKSEARPANACVWIRLGSDSSLVCDDPK